MKSKLTKSDMDRIIPPKKKDEAIEQSERYEREYELSKKELDDMIKKLDELLEKLKNSEIHNE